MATDAEVERALRALAKKIADASPDPAVVPDRTILCVLSDSGSAFRAELVGARLKGIKKVPQTDKAEVKITARSDDLIALIDGRLSASMAFLMGKVRIDAPARDLMLLRRLF